MTPIHPATARAQRLPPAGLVAYGAFGMPLAMAALPLYVHLPRFYGETLGVNLAALGVLLLVLRLADGVIDPLLGAWSDRIGARRAIVGWTAPVLAVGMVALFAPPVRSEAALLLWLGGALVVVYLAFSIATINHGAWGAELSRSSTERTRITAVREALALCGVVIASVAPTLLAGEEGDASGLQRFTWLFAAVAWACLVLLRLAPLPTTKPHTARRAVFADSVRSLRDARFRRLLAVFMANGIASAIPATLVLFFIADVLRAESAQGWFLALYFIAGAAGMPVWVALASRAGKAVAWAVSMIVAIGAFVWAYTLGAGDVVAFAWICGLSGAALGADLALPPSLLADLIDRPDARAGAGAYFGLWTLATKLNLALAAGIALPALTVLGYGPGSTDGGALRSLALVYALVPCALKLVAFALVLTMRGRFDRHEEMP